jgi:hypothetical protein
MQIESKHENTPPEQLPHGQCGCGDDAEKKALLEVAEAEADATEADREIERALRHGQEAHQKLEKAEGDLDEARRQPHVIHIWVDGEEFETTQREWTPNQIIADVGHRDPATDYLVRIEGHHKESFQGKGDIPIEIHDCERFQIISTGPTPVSDGTKLTGTAAFAAGLKAEGYSPTIVAGTTDHVMFDYMVQTGIYAGTQFRLGFVVPPDFPLSAPGGPHVSPRIHPNKGGQTHPLDGIGDSSFQGKVGGDWHYWSRPFKDWGTSKKTVAAYMSHVWRLWDSQ